MPHPTLGADDYSRIYSVIEAVIEPFSKDPRKSCLFFGMAGALILNKQFGIAAKPIMGAALYCVRSAPNPDVLTFGRIEDLQVSSDENAFHCWIETEEDVIDFMSPLFSQMDFGNQIKSTIPRKSFQKPKAAMLPDLDFEKSGDFYLVPNPLLTQSLILKNLARNDVKDLFDVCNNWFKPVPRTIPQTLMVGSNDGSSHALRLRPARLEGPW